ncbi:BrnT family toxin [Methylobacterium sp. J-068]|uniref:BrnT family toxin n=1 Tax=Methylobacterium sp. J-068 TaxID=2836649 RepID=UPI001FBA5020|nr:BrnT family toxin [Methylobacterium sp. J-068]MCJ2036465.1 BrnT family toxin [Methylobacterium sp. J-068]
MPISFDPAKRDRALAERGLDFADAETVFAGPCFSFEDERANYGETRIMTAGLLVGRMVVIVWTPRGADRHVISMRKANDREQARYATHLR